MKTTRLHQRKWKNQKKKKQNERDLQSKQRRYILPDIHVPLGIADDDIPDAFDHPARTASVPQIGYHNRLRKITHGKGGNVTISNGYGVTSTNSPVKLPVITEGNKPERPNSWGGENTMKYSRGIQLRKNASVTKLTQNEVEDRNPKRKTKSQKQNVKRKSKKGEIAPIESPLAKKATIHHVIHR